MHPNTLPHRIYIVGFMGAGKTTIGKKLAAALGYSFYDTDKLIEAREGMSVPEIFRIKGESYFRDLEAKVLKETFLFEKAVIATGGGLPCHSDHIKTINLNGASIYLRAPEALLFRRIRQGAGKRPLVNGMSEAELREFIHLRLGERNPYYMQATHVFDIPWASVETIVKSMV